MRLLFAVAEDRSKAFSLSMHASRSLLAAQEVIMATDNRELFEKQIDAWSGVAPPNDVARTMAAQLDALIRSFEALRGQIVFEDEPSSFEAALVATKDRE